jgi:hypothetical protein
MLRHPAFRIFLLGVVILLALAYFGPRFGLIGCDTLPDLSIGPCAVGRQHDNSR